MADSGTRYEGVGAYARRMGVTERTVYNWLKRGRIAGAVRRHRTVATGFRFPVPPTRRNPEKQERRRS